MNDYFIAVSFKVFGCELPENGGQLQRTEPRSGETDISKIMHFLVIMDCKLPTNNSQNSLCWFSVVN
jgi:hypothetical protein